MSSSNKAASKGGKSVKSDKSQKSEKTDSKGKSGEKQPHRDANSKNEDPSLKDKVKELIEMSHRSEEEVCWALQECDYDANLAMNMLLEDMGTGEWETRVKKKKNRQASASKQEKIDEAPPVDDWNDAAPPTGNIQGDKDKPRNGNRARQNNRGWRGRERQENDRNLEEGGRGDRPRGDRERRGRPGSRGGGGGRGGRGGGRAGGRYLPRGRSSNNAYNKPIDTWDNSNTWDNNTVAANHTKDDNWDDFPGTDEWSTEEYQGSLADTKVFTPSIPPTTLDTVTEQPGSINVMQDQTFGKDQLGQTLQLGQHGMPRPPQSPVPPMVGTLTAAQTQYFSQLQQNNDSLNKTYQNQSYSSQTFDKTTANQYNNSATVQYNSGSANQFGSGATNQSYVSSNQQYGTQANPNQYGTDTNTFQPNAFVGQDNVPQQPTRPKTQRARVPPPSKIPSSAVEMPGDLNSSIGYLDVQFGAMDLIDTSTTFDGGIDPKYGATTQTNTLDGTTGIGGAGGNLDLTSTSVNQNSLDAYSPKSNAQNSINSALSQSLSNADSIPPASEHVTNTYNSIPRSTQVNTTTSSSVAASGLDLGAKGSDSHSYSSQTSTYNSYQPKSNTYNSATYAGSTTVSSYSNQANSYSTSQSGAYNTTSVNTYPNTYSSNNSYQSNTNSTSFPSITQANNYSNTQSYPQNTSQSAYGANTGLNNSSNYGVTTTSQYNNYSSSNKMGKDASSYENNSSTSTNSQTTSTGSVTTTTSLSLSQTGVTTSKTSTTLAAKNSSIVSNIPPGVAPVMSTPYMIGQVPYFQQPVYSYEEMQLLQQRLPHMTTTPYYDMSYQTPTTLAAVRDAAALGNVGYSLSSDGRFARTDNNASPVPTTLSQQTSTLTQGHQAQPILAGTAPSYFFAPFNTIAPNYQFGTMYTQLPAATNAHGSSNSSQYPKPATYGSGYGSYDALNQSQDYTKGGYVSNTQAQKASGGNVSSSGTTGNDLSAMYAKSHTALGKVNSYEKQGFHSGTPPPFTGALHGSQNAGLAPSGTGYAPQVYIPTMAPHQQHHTTHLMQQPLHQMDVRHQNRRMDTGSAGGQRSQATNQAKSGPKQPYQTSYWNQA